ncbi:MAG: ABC transporter ATP-binding protein [Ignavibacteriae bacterium]|nr:ABC transporter ATP-binding protein [Ignavibacteriota bacterium]
MYSIEVNNLNKTFGNFVAVNDISFKVKAGEIFGFLGANGAGKSTTIKMLCGLLSPTGGDALVGGYSIKNQSDLVKQNIGYMSQKFSLYNDLTVEENIRFFGGVYGLEGKGLNTRMQWILKTANLIGKENLLTASLPGGIKQRLALGTAVIHKPKIVFLDEPTGGVDPITRRQFWEMIYKAAHNGTTIFVTTHYMDEAEYCDRVSIMVNGKIEALDTPKKLKAHYKTDTMNDVFLKLARG